MRVELSGVYKAYGKVKALSGVGLTVEPGTIVAVLGANGAGKTTLFRCLAGLVVPDQGEVLYDGQAFRRTRLDLRRRFMFLPDTPAVIPSMTPLQHVAMCLRLYEVTGEALETRVVELFRELGIATLAESPMATFSRGELYKAALVGLLAVDPELWIVDEPFASGMDPVGLAAFKNHAAEASSRGKTILYSTQIVEVAEGFADRACILHEGIVYAYGTMAELRERAGRQEAALEALLARLGSNR